MGKKKKTKGNKGKSETFKGTAQEAEQGSATADAPAPEPAPSSAPKSEPEPPPQPTPAPSQQDTFNIDVDRCATDPEYLLQIIKQMREVGTAALRQTAAQPGDTLTQTKEKSGCQASVLEPMREQLRSVFYCLHHRISYDTIDANLALALYVITNLKLLWLNLSTPSANQAAHLQASQSLTTHCAHWIASKPSVTTMLLKTLDCTGYMVEFYHDYEERNLHAETLYLLSKLYLNTITQLTDEDREDSSHFSALSKHTDIILLSKCIECKLRLKNEHAQTSADDMRMLDERLNQFFTQLKCLAGTAPEKIHQIMSTARIHYKTLISLKSEMSRLRVKDDNNVILSALVLCFIERAQTIDSASAKEFLADVNTTEHMITQRHTGTAKALDLVQSSNDLDWLSYSMMHCAWMVYDALLNKLIAENRFKEFVISRGSYTVLVQEDEESTSLTFDDFFDFLVYQCTLAKRYAQEPLYRATTPICEVLASLARQTVNGDSGEFAWALESIVRAVDKGAPALVDRVDGYWSDIISCMVHFQDQSLLEYIERHHLEKLPRPTQTLIRTMSCSNETHGVFETIVSDLKSDAFTTDLVQAEKSIKRIIEATNINLVLMQAGNADEASRVLAENSQYVMAVSEACLHYVSQPNMSKALTIRFNALVLLYFYLQKLGAIAEREKR